MLKILAMAASGAVLLASPAIAQDPLPDLGPVLSAVVEALDSPTRNINPTTGLCPSRRGPAPCPTTVPEDYTPLLVLSPETPRPAAAEAYGRPILMLSEDEAREQQRAYFYRIGRVTRTPEGLSLVYGHPSNGMSGRIDLVADGERWVVSAHDSSHSSSGARYAYGEMYDGVVCRDGTEMAARWVNMIGLMQSFQQRRASDFEPIPTAQATCPGREFPEVRAYRDMRDR